MDQEWTWTGSGPELDKKQNIWLHRENVKWNNFVVDEETDDPAFTQIKGNDAEFPDTMDDLTLELKDSDNFYITKVSPGVWNVGVQGSKIITNQ